MKIDVYALCRSGHHSISFWLAKNIVPSASVDLTYEQGDKTVRMVNAAVKHTLNLKENERLPEGNEPTIIILRDPYNNFASFLKLTKNPNFGTLSFLSFMKYWVEYAKEVSGETNRLTNKVVISYNDWVDSETYRRNVVEYIGEKFGLETKFDDSLKNQMTKYGGGSSFDGLTHIRSADKMKVCERFKEFEGLRTYRGEVDTPQVRGLADKIFNFYPWPPVEKKDNSEMLRILNGMF